MADPGSVKVLTTRVKFNHGLFQEDEDLAGGVRGAEGRHQSREITALSYVGRDKFLRTLVASGGSSVMREHRKVRRLALVPTGHHGNKQLRSQPVSDFLEEPLIIQEFH
ncbi:hypothetical protein EON65_37385 [archaeon]|nr:MAG: hypothetical protein EON65_37385 [archaeon]